MRRALILLLVAVLVALVAGAAWSRVPHGVKNECVSHPHTVQLKIGPGRPPMCK